MIKQGSHPGKDEVPAQPLTEEKRQRKQHALSRGTPSITRSIADALVIKNDNIYFLCQPNGDVPLTGNHGYGLYYHDCRYLRGYELRIAQSLPTVLVSTAQTGFSAIIELSNPEIVTPDGTHITRDMVGIRWERALDGNLNQLTDCLTLQNYSLQELTLPIRFAFQSRFEDIFYVRGLLRLQPGELHPPRWQGSTLVYEYDGADGLIRCLTIGFSPGPQHGDDPAAAYAIHLKPRETTEIWLNFCVYEDPHPPTITPQASSRETVKQVGTKFDQHTAQWQSGQAVLRSRERFVQAVIDRSMTDLRTLISSFDHEKYYAAGIPWFATLFGRDSIISSMQMLPIQPAIAADTLRLLARYQATELNPWKDAQPGKILHELREGELAHIGDIPHTPYYGSVDATPLFLVLVARHAAWTGSLDLFHELQPHIEAALNWIDQYGDSDGDGYLDYQGHSNHGLINQGWKDSGTAIVNADGSMAVPPIALPEVQGFVYRAWLGMADLFARAGDSRRAETLRRQAAVLRDRFDRDFWSDRLGAYVLALQAGGRPAEVLASNIGQVLWSGIASNEHAAATAERLMGEDMFNGWGIRTLSCLDNSYNPTGYHLGTVWPFDNALIAAGLRRYGQDAPAEQIVTALFEAADHFDLFRLPELFAGFSRADYGIPVNYPVACHPQAWSASSVPYLLTTLLGLVPDGFNKRLWIVRPRLPEQLGPIEIHGLAVGDGRVYLGFSPTGGDSAKVEILRVEGKLDIEVVPDSGDFDF